MSTRATRRIAPSEILYFVLAAISVPFLVTGVFRVIPEAWPTATPFGVMLVVAALAWPLAGRAVAAGISAGTIAWAVFLYWLLNEMSGLNGL